MKRSV